MQVYYYCVMPQQAAGYNSYVLCQYKLLLRFIIQQIFFITIYFPFSLLSFPQKKSFTPLYQLLQQHPLLMPPSIAKLPPEVLDFVFEPLEPVDAAQCQLVCSKLKKCSTRKALQGHQCLFNPKIQLFS